MFPSFKISFLTTKRCSFIILARFFFNFIFHRLWKMLLFLKWVYFWRMCDISHYSISSVDWKCLLKQIFLVKYSSTCPSQWPVRHAVTRPKTLQLLNSWKNDSIFPVLKLQEKDIVSQQNPLNLESRCHSLAFSTQSLLCNVANDKLLDQKMHHQLNWIPSINHFR